MSRARAALRFPASCLAFGFSVIVVLFMGHDRAQLLKTRFLRMETEGDVVGLRLTGL